MNFGSLNYFLGILVNRKEKKKNEKTQWAGVLAQDHSVGA
jgi:hypothetical protein